ncbi:MAG: rhamnulokinase [Bacteroidales bacterium]|nr:rhamnulokinase [Bacteroidales bacterium]
MKSSSFLAFDLGASGGRGIIGELKDKVLTFNEVCRFNNSMTLILGSYHWDILRLFDEIVKGIAAANGFGIRPESIGIDTWGVDYGLLDKKGNLLGNPYAYRDHRTDTAIEEFSAILPLNRIYMLTGIQFMQFNTLFQLFAAKRDKLPIMDIASDLLFIPDLLNYMLTGIKKTEFTFATTSQLLNPSTGRWEKELFDALGISVNIMQEIVEPGTLLGPMHKSVIDETGMQDARVIAVASHDTGSAIAAIPATDENFAYISSGTWSLMGIESPKAIITEDSFNYSFTNEGGVNHTYRILKNIMGLWLIQECKRCWAGSMQDYSYPEIVAMAEKAAPFRTLINPDDASFYNPGDMPTAISDYCKTHSEPLPSQPGDFARCIFESLALKYRFVLESLRKISGKKIDRIHIIGGGSQNKFLCQLAANATGLQVTAGPAEGTAIGNLLVQALGLGYVKSLGEIREIVKNSCETEVYKPVDTDKWDGVYDRFLKIVTSEKRKVKNEK